MAARGRVSRRRVGCRPRRLGARLFGGVGREGDGNAGRLFGPGPAADNISCKDGGLCWQFMYQAVDASSRSEPSRCWTRTANRAACSWAVI